MSSRPKQPAFKPTTSDYYAWFQAMGAEDRVRLAQFLVTLEARSVAAHVIDEAIVEAVKNETYEVVAHRFGCTKGNIQRRLTRARAAAGTKQPARKRGTIVTEKSPRTRRPAGAEKPSPEAPAPDGQRPGAPELAFVAP